MVDIEALVEQTTEVGQLRRELRTERDKSGRLAAELAETRKTLELAEAVHGANPQPPKWVTGKPKKRHTATAGLLITDTHLDEVVNPDEVGGLNAYSRDIAYQRLERCFVGAVKVLRDYVSGIDIDGIVVLWGGDIVSGEIHDELTQSNEASTVETLVHWLEPLTAGVDLLAGEFGRVHNVGVPGNHGRRSKKPRYKGRSHDNYDWLMYRLLARQHVNRDDVTWQIPDSPFADVQIHDLHLRLEHGDEAKGGSGISAAMSPLMLRQHRLAKQYASAGRELDLLVTGHFHRRHFSPGLLVGASLKGDDEYSLGKGFDHAEPSQEAFIVAPERGVILNAPIWVQDRQVEGW